MNWLLVSSTAGDVVSMSPRQRHHVETVLKANVGDKLRVCVLGKGRGEGVLLKNGELRLSSLDDTKSLRHQVGLAMPRPKVLSRILVALATFGIREIHLFRSWRVEKSYLQTHKLDPDFIRGKLHEGMEQGGIAFEPTVVVHSLFLDFIEKTKKFPDRKVALDPSGQTAFPGHEKSGDYLVTLGPEGGWIERELETFAENGFSIQSLGPTVWKTEHAVVAALSRMDELKDAPI